MERQNRVRQMRWIMVIGGTVLVGVLAYSSYEATHKKYQVCMSFKGAIHCAIATGATPDDAIRSAQEIDCELVTNGRDELTSCLSMQPTNVEEVK
jgi:hypothetical protein